jgi:hypothetical protein
MIPTDQFVQNGKPAALVAGKFPDLPLQVAALIGIAAGMGFNYTLSRYLVLGKLARQASRRRLP